MKSVILLLTLILTSCTPKYDLVIRDVNIIDINNGEITKGDVLIKDSSIVEINKPNAISKRTIRTIDASDNYLIPALWDMHVHIQDSTYFSMFLDYGITGVRDMGGRVDNPTDGCESLSPEYMSEWKNTIKNGILDGPQLFIAGTHLSGTGWPTSFPVSSKEDIKNAFDQNLRDKVDFIKVYEKISWESYQEIARLSEQYNLDFAGHVSEPFLLSDILDLGQKSIEHIREPILYSFTNDSMVLENFMVEDNYTKEDREFVKPWIDDAENVIDAFKRNKAWFTPTMSVQLARSRFQDDEWINHPLRNQMPSSVNEGMHNHLKAMMASQDHKVDSLWWMALTKLVKRFSNEGIGLLAGSDASCEGGLPGYSLHEELFLMVEEAGLSPLEALQTATTNPAMYFDLKNYGQLKESYYADLLLLANNPLENIRNTLSIKSVIKKGKVVRLN
ncbi:MAG: amidohydrolase family protein [Balneola sp.]